jgi:hypothetical protein
MAGHPSAAPRGPDAGAGADVLRQFVPPFALTADMLFAGACCPAEPLQAAFPHVPFLTAGRRALLLLWYSRVTRACYHDAVGRQHCEGDGRAPLYYELNVMAPLRQPNLFVPAIYATGERTIRIGRAYGMPKQAATGAMRRRGGDIEAWVQSGAQRSLLRARLLGSGRSLASLLAPSWPRHVWPARFPSGAALRVTLEAVPRLQPARIYSGRLALAAAWLPQAAPLLPLGLYVPGLRMRLPPPGGGERGTRRGCDGPAR